MRLSQILSETKVVSVSISGDTLAVTYRPQAVTPEMVDRMNGANSAPGDAIASTVVDLVHEWDLTDDNGKSYPITLETVRKLPVSFLSAVTQAITTDINPNPQKRNN